MNQSSQETMAAIKANLVAGVATVDEALEGAYRLGEFDGAIKMAKAGQEQVAELLRKAA